MNTIIIWHNPRCSKSREALSIIEENGQEKEIVKYLEISPSSQEIQKVLSMLGVTPRELMRTKEEIYKELKLKDVEDNAQLIQAMAKHPSLIERPVLIKGNRAIIGRPTSIIKDFLRN